MKVEELITSKGEVTWVATLGELVYYCDTRQEAEAWIRYMVQQNSPQLQLATH